MYKIWKCSCGNLHGSISARRHDFNQCPKCKDFVDLEEEYCRLGGNPKTIKDYNYDFFTELKTCLFNQDIQIAVIVDLLFGAPVRYYDFTQIRKIEDEMVKQLISNHTPLLVKLPGETRKPEVISGRTTKCLAKGGVKKMILVNTHAFDEILTCAVAQGFIKPFKFLGITHISILDYFKIKDLQW